MKKILINFILYLIIMSGSILLIGSFEVMRNEFMYDIVENSVLVQADTPINIYDKYLEFKADPLFDNTYFILVLNFFGILFVI
jgi:hypothetical protein